MSIEAQNPRVLRSRILAAVEAERQRLADAERQHREALHEIGQRNNAKRAEHDVLADAARQALESVPPLPELEDGHAHQDALHMIVTVRRGLKELRRQALAAAVDDVERAWPEARAALDRQARKIHAEAAVLAADYADWHALLYDVRRARDTTPNKTVHGGPSDRMPPKPTAFDVLRAAMGEDVTAPKPITHRRQPVTGKILRG